MAKAEITGIIEALQQVVIDVKELEKLKEEGIKLRQAFEKRIEQMVKRY
jgi:uncharacterized membrane protein (DUF106 family)